ncbi:HEAT repeat domain-containing protein [Actinomadura alba]|uniref:HEAT repeat domain-containing protein n=1 Tax=Actinomadura alba TaxID=406431 RepID=UPI0028A84BC4|nr:HEAT repeat domain-containing protein [Actinomadura alba]
MTTTDTPSTRIAALYRLERPELPDIEEHLRDPAPEVRKAALIMLTRTAPAGAGDTLAWALADEDHSVREVAAESLRVLAEVYIGEDGVRALLLAAAHGRDARLRETAVELLALLTEGAREQYADGLRDGEPEVRLQAIIGLIALGAVTEVAQAAGDPAREVRVGVAEGLARLKSPAGLPALERLIVDHDAVVRIAAIDAATDLGMPPPLAERVASTLEHPDWRVRARAATALRAAAPEIAIGLLVRALGDRVVDVRRAAVRSLEPWADDRPEVVTALVEALADPDAGVRTQVRWVLG